MALSMHCDEPNIFLFWVTNSFKTVPSLLATYLPWASQSICFNEIWDFSHRQNDDIKKWTCLARYVLQISEWFQFTLPSSKWSHILRSTEWSHIILTTKIWSHILLLSAKWSHCVLPSAEWSLLTECWMVPLHITYCWIVYSSWVLNSPTLYYLVLNGSC